MKESVLTLSLGTNLGDRESNIAQALSRLDTELTVKRLAISQIINTKSVGFEGPDFLNVVVQYSCSEDPYEILRICKKIEYDMGRREIVEYDAEGNRIHHDRTIDIDILKYGDYVIDTELLRIPHPQVFSRNYVKELIKQLPYR